MRRACLRSTAAQQATLDVVFSVSVAVPLLGFRCWCWCLYWVWFWPGGCNVLPKREHGHDHEDDCEQSGVNKYTGIAEEDDAGNDHDLDLLGKGTGQDQDTHDREDAPIAEGHCLPEERFHRADIVSQHMIDTREQQRKEKVRHGKDD